MSEQSIKPFNTNDAPPVEPREEENKTPDLSKGITPDDHRKVFAQEREKQSEKVPNVEIETREVTNDRTPAPQPKPGQQPQPFVIDVNKIKVGGNEPKPEAPKPEAPKPEAPKPEAPKTEAPKPEAPKLEAPKTEAPKPEAPKPEAAKPIEGRRLEGVELTRGRYLQDTLVSLANIYAKSEDVAKTREDVRKEREAGVFGPATQAAFDKYAKWLDTRVLVAIKEMDSLQLALPAGCPIKLPSDQYQRAINPELFKALASIDEVSLDMKSADKTKVPTDAQLDTMDAAFDWIKACNTSASEARNAFRDRTLTKLIEDNHLPEGWKKKDGDDPELWRDSAERMIDLSMRMKNYIEAMQSLYKSSRHNDFPMELPAGVSITIEANGKTRTVTANDINDYDVRQMLKDGKIKEIDLGLPKDLRQEDPTNAERLKFMRDWLKQHGDKIDQAIGELIKLQQNPDSVIMYGDSEVKNGKGRFNADGEFLGLVDEGKYRLKPGESLRDVNLVGYNYEVTKITDEYIASQPPAKRADLEKHKGEFMVTQTIQAEHAPPWAYLNARCLGIEKVGSAMPVDVKFVKEDDFVPVRNGAKIEIVKGKNLQSFKNMQMGWYWGEKIVVASLDVAMLVTGTIEIGAAVKGARLATVGAEAALKMGTREALWEGSKGALRVTAAAAGVFNNAGGRETKIGQAAETFRAIYFPLDIGAGLVGGTWRLARNGVNWLRGAEAAESALNGSQKVHMIIHGLEDTKSIKALGQLAEVSKGAEGMEKALQAGRTAEAAAKAAEAAKAADALKVTLESLKTAESLQRAAQAGELAAALRAAAASGDTAAALAKVLEVSKGATTLKDALEITKAANTFKGMPFFGGLHTGMSYAFKGTEGFYLAVLTPNFWNDITGNGKKPRDAANDALIMIGDGRGNQAAVAGSFNMGDKKMREATEALLNSYGSTLQEGRPDAAKQQIGDVLKDAIKYLNPAANAQEKEALKQRLVANLTFTPEQIQELEKAFPQSRSSKDFKISAAQISDLMDPDKLRTYPKPVRELAEKFMGEKDKDVVAASRVALMYLCRDNDGNMGADLAAVSLKVAGYKRKVMGEDKDIAERDIEIKIPTAGNVDALRRDLARTEPGNRSLVIADCLSRLGDPNRPGYGAITHQQFGAVLQNILMSDKSTREQKMRALTDPSSARMATVIDALRFAEAQKLNRPETNAQADFEKGRFFGTDSKGLMRTLEHTAKNDKDPDVRAMAASLIYGLGEGDQARKSLLLQGFNAEWQKLGKTPGSFADKISDFLFDEMATKVPEGGDAARADAIRLGKLSAARALAAMTPDTDANVQKRITAAMVEALSTTRPVLALDVLKELMPARLAQLQKDDAVLANKLRSEALKLIRLPQNLQESRIISDIIGRMEPLLKDGDPEFKKQLAGKLQDFLSNSQYATNSAKNFGNIRAASIDTLARLGSQDSLDVIRSHATAEAKFKVGDKELAAGEQDPVVRAAAVKALEELKDPQLRAIINDLIDKETDATTATRLRDVRFLNQRLDPSSREYKEKYEDALKEVIGSLAKYPHLKDFGDAQQLAWIRANFDVLDVDTFRQRCHDAAYNAYSGAWYALPWVTKEEAKWEEQKKITPIQNERLEQWKRLRELATTGTGVEADKAKMALHYIMTHNGHPCGGDQGHVIHVDGYVYNSNLYNSDYKALASRALVDCADKGASGRDITAYIVRQGLKSSQLPGYVSVDLLDAWNKLGERGRDGYAIPREQLAKVVAEALDTEIQRQKANQTDYYQESLLESLKTHKHRMVFPVLDALAEKSQFDRIKTQARTILADFQHSVSMMYDETVADQTATAQARSDRVKRSLEERNNSEITVQEIFSAYKGYNLNNPADVGLAQLQLALNESNERVRMAASRVLIQSGLPAAHPAKVKAIATLRELQQRGSQPRYRTDAGDLLKANGVQ